MPSSRPHFDLPTPSAPRTASARQPRQPRTHRSRGSDPIHNIARFRDDELESQSDAIVIHHWSGNDREGILRWARAVQPGLEEEAVSPAPYMEHQTPAVAELHKVLYRSSPFPLTVQNLAPPCVTVESRHHALLNNTSLHAHLEDRTAASQSQDDASLLTPATESVVAPSLPDVPQTSIKPFIGRIMNHVYSWMASPTRLPSSRSEDSGIVHSDETQRVKELLPRKSTAAMDMPATPIRRRDFSVVSYASDNA